MTATHVTPLPRHRPRPTAPFPALSCPISWPFPAPFLPIVLLPPLSGHPVTHLALLVLLLVRNRRSNAC